MPTTAIVIPAKYVYVSPTNTEEGYLENMKMQTFSVLVTQTSNTKERAQDIPQ